MKWFNNPQTWKIYGQCLKVRKFPQTIKKFYHLPKYENSVVIQPIKANNGSIINVVVAKEPIKNIQQIIDAYIDK
ncbi:MAG: hypothetical protein RSF40_03545 [Oscillospiraceae bacterium]